MVRPRTARVRNLSRAGVSPARLVVRRVRCRLGVASRRGSSFRPLVSRGAAQLHQPSGAVSDFLALRHFLPLVQNSTVAVYADNTTALAYLRNQGGHQVCGLEPDSSGPPSLGRAPFNLSSASIYHGSQQRVGRLSFSSTSGSGFRVDPELSVFQQLRRKWPVSIDLFATSLNHRCLPLFFSVPRSQCSWDGCASPTMGWVAGVCLSSICSYSCDSEKAPLVLWGPADNHSSLLAPEAVVSGAFGACSERSSGSASGQGSFEPVSCAPSTSGAVKASSSCLETIQRFV